MDQLGADDRRAHARRHLQGLDRNRPRLRHGGDRDDHDALFFYIVRHYWHTSLWIVVPGAVALLSVDLLFVAATLTKFVHGAWLPLLVGLVFFTILTTWQRGRELVTDLRQREKGPLRPFVEQLHAMKPPLQRVPGTWVARVSTSEAC